MSKRKQPADAEPDAPPAEPPSTQARTHPVPASNFPSLGPTLLNFDDDTATVAPKFGSDPEALNGDKNELEVKLTNTKNPQTGELSKNVCVLYRVPWRLKSKKDEIQDSLQRLAFGGTVSKVSSVPQCPCPRAPYALAHSPPRRR